MIVTFISQCEKKALNKTRRVLDAFANRIGSNTWQTVITEQGLQTVKKLLRKTATKNTAVSCHRIRSRSRSEFLWVVGSKDEFNKAGIVPVNYTNKIGVLKMDELNVNIENYYANTKKQPLDQHLFAVGYVSYLLCTQLIDDDKLALAAFVAGCWHDMGKIDPSFQQWIIEKTKSKLIDKIPEEGQHIDKNSGAFSFEKHPRHNEISLLFYYLFDDPNDLSIIKNKANKQLIKHTIFWHHAKPIRKEPFRKIETIYNKLSAALKDKTVDHFAKTIQSLITSINSISSECNLNLKLGNILKKSNEDSLSELRTDLPGYKSYGEDGNIDSYQKDVEHNARNNIARTVVVSADRLVSALSAESLTAHIEQNTLSELVSSALLSERQLISDIKACLKGFNSNNPDIERNKHQQKAALELSDEDISVGVLNGPAGCGKTKIALEWAANSHAKKIIWVCPRVQVCQGLVKDLISKEYLPHTKIEICTGEFKSIYQNGLEEPTDEGQEFSGDIVLTTIDQVINTITSHTKVTGLVHFMNAHVIFDEYHEYIPMDGFNLLFAELVACKKQNNKQSNTLLVSATPNFYFVEEFLGIDDIITVSSFNQSRYKIEFETFDDKSEDNSNPLYSPQTNNTIVISNTAITAQKSFIKNQNNENSLLIHSKFKPSDRKKLFEDVYSSFKKQGTKKYNVLRSGPIIQASLNITCDKMITEFSNAENWLQRLGRLDRFGENKEPNLYVSAITEHVKNGKSLGNARFLNSLYCLHSTKVWFDFLQHKLPDDHIVSITDLYRIYKQFYQDSNCINAIEQDLITALKKSAQAIELKIIDPITFPNKVKKPKDAVKIKNNSLRGNNRFVQMAEITINNQKIELSNDYAFIEEAFTLSVNEILGYEDSEKNLLNFMAKKHHSMFEAKTYGITAKSKYKDKTYLKKSKEAETPIYLSYTPDDLKIIEAEAHPYAIYYAQGVKQPIGAISIDKLVTVK